MKESITAKEKEEHARLVDKYFDAEGMTPQEIARMQRIANKIYENDKKRSTGQG